VVMRYYEEMTRGLAPIHKFYYDLTMGETVITISKVENGYAVLSWNYAPCRCCDSKQVWTEEDFENYRKEKMVVYETEEAALADPIFEEMRYWEDLDAREEEILASMFPEELSEEDKGIFASLMKQYKGE
jgi:hypothetical protein